MKKQKITALTLVIVMIFTMLPVSVLCASESTEAVWKGAMNYNDSNNYVTSVSSIPSYNRAEIKWAYPLNTSVMDGGAYYAGQCIIVDNYLYATGGGKLHKVYIEDGTGVIINENAGSTVSYYDYLCYADGILILSTQDSISAYSMDGSLLGSVEGAFGEYHPIQYYDEHIICNGFIYKVYKENENVNFVQIGDTTIGEDAFNWSSGAFVDGLFYVAAKTTVYAVDYKTNSTIDSYTFDVNRTATKNVQGGLCYDAKTGRLFWATYTYNSFIHSIAIDDNGFDENSYISEDAGQKSVATPVVYNDRVYIAGQQGRICVHNTSDLSKVYDYVTLGGGKVQGTPILSTADGHIRIYTQCSNGHLYMFTDKGDYGETIKLAETANYTGVAYPYAGFEQYAMDNSGNIYCYNESGYLFCFGKTGCEKPTVITNLSAERIKYGVNSKTEALSVAATVSEGEISYQWQSGSDGYTFTDIEGATDSTYIPSSDAEGTTYYRCIITNRVGVNTAYEISNVANVLVKKLSNNTNINAMVGKTNSATAASNTAVAIPDEDGVLYIENCNFDVKNVFLGVADEGNISSVEFIYGAGTTAPKKYSVNNDKYIERYYKNPYSKPIVAKVSVTAEDGLSTDEKYLIVSEDGAGKYITKAAISSESEYFKGDTIKFSETEQSAVLSVKEVESVGSGEIYNPQWSWLSSDNGVVTVDENGTVKCIGGGTAVVTASYDEVSASVNIVSDAAEHTIHTYVNSACSKCGHEEPEKIAAKFTVINEENNPVVSKNGITEMYKTEIFVGDFDCDGVLTLNDAFWEVHAQHSINGSSDFSTEESSYGPFITRLWGKQTSDIAYMVNDIAFFSLLTDLNNNDIITAYFYRDTENYSDIYSYIEGRNVITEGIDEEFEVKGICSSGSVIAKGATAELFNQNGEMIFSSTVGEDGKVILSIDNAGEYVLKISGNASYTGSVWNSETGDYKDKEFTSASVVVSKFNITVLPYTEKTVYITIATKNGEFAVNKNGDDMWNFPVTVTDNSDSPDGIVTISEMLKAAHEQYHPDGLTAFVIEKSKYGDFITKLWGENNGGNCLYYFNNTEMNGTGIKTGSNSREWEDKLLDTVVETGDEFTIYSLQATDYTKSDLYTYFDEKSESATTGKEKIFTLKSVAGYGNNSVAASLVTVYDNEGNKLKNLSTIVNEDGTFKLVFTKEGTYTVDVRTNGANYISPSRCIVNVKDENSSSGGGDIIPADKISVYFTLLGDDKHGIPAGTGDIHTKKKGNLDTWISKTKIIVDKGSYVIDAVEKALSTNNISYKNEDNYISEIKGLAEFDNGSLSGWMYMLNGKYPSNAINEQKLSDGDSVIIHYTDDYTAEKTSYSGGFSSSAVSKPKKDITGAVENDVDKTTETKEKNTFSESIYTDVKADDWYYEAVKFAYENNLMNGTGKGFEPDNKMTRAMLITVLWRMEKEPCTNHPVSFDDVKSDEWYTKAVSWAAGENIITGIGNNLFGTDDEITREQITTMLYRYVTKKNVETESENIDIKHYADNEAVSDYAASAVKWAINSGILKGKTETALCPADFATRAEVAMILMRFCGVMSK